MKIKPPLDADTMALAQQTVRAARRSGEDVVEALHRLGLIWSPERVAQVQQAAVDYLLQRFYDIRPAEMMRRSRNGSQTPRVMYDTMIEFIEEYRQTLKEKR